MSREPARPHYDAVVDLFPVGRQLPEMAYALVKFVFHIEEHGCTLAEAEPLFHDIRDPELEEPLLPGSEFWTTKLATDVVVRGSAYAPYGRPTDSMQVSVSVGNTVKAIRILGKRTASWKTGYLPVFSPPEPFTEVPLVWENAYGGADARVPISDGPLTEEEVLRAHADHPGLYPRNPLGKGYVVLPDGAEDVELPQLEWPTDLLTPERFIVGDPRSWYLQPMPACYEFMNPLQFPRFVYLGLDAWFTPPDDDRLPEVREGFVPASYRSHFGTHWDPGVETAPPYFQEGSLGMVFPHLPEGTPVMIRGMHPDEKEISFTLPREPLIEIEIEGQREACPPQLTTVLIEPSERKVSLVYIARKMGLPRDLVPGIHGYIPLSVTVNREPPVVYETPPTVREQLEVAKAAEAAAKAATEPEG